MISATLLIAAAAGVLLLWPASQPQKPQPVIPSLPDSAAAPSQRPSYHSAMTALAVVRTRLSQTETLTEKERECITSLTVALIAGSDR